MTETSLYEVRAIFSFDEDPLEQILLQTDTSAWFNSLESEFEISGFCGSLENDFTTYFNFESISFECINDLRSGIAIAVIEASFKVNNAFVFEMISRYIKSVNRGFRIIGGDSGPIDIVFNDFKIEVLK